jgi:tRNA pseudouridine55 synthase
VLTPSEMMSEDCQIDKSAGVGVHTNLQDGSGVFLIDKPSGPTSFAIVKQVRRIIGIKKVGHSGTLDPLASGLLIICAGRPATKIIPMLMEGEKEYEATIKLGVETDTHDMEGRVVSRKAVPEISEQEIAECLASFTGRQLQTPPQFSALKHNGKPLYYYARRGIKVEKAEREIEISSIDCLNIARDEFVVRIVCSKGTYVRVLAADIGRSLGCGGHLTALRRTRSGPFTVAYALAGDVLADKQDAFRLLTENCKSVDEVKEILAQKGREAEAGADQDFCKEL